MMIFLVIRLCIRRLALCFSRLIAEGVFGMARFQETRSGPVGVEPDRPGDPGRERRVPVRPIRSKRASISRTGRRFKSSARFWSRWATSR